MRPLIVLLAIVVALPFAVGQGPSGGPDGRPGQADGGNETGNDTQGGPDAGPAQACRGAQERRDCYVAYCADEPVHPQCQRLAGSDCASADCAELSRACEVAQRGDVRSQRACQALQRLDAIRQDARHVTFELDAEGRLIRNYTVDGDLLVASIAYGDLDDEFSSSHQGQRIRFESGDARLEIHDSPTGDFWFRSAQGKLLLTFPDGVAITATPRGHMAAYEGRTAILAGDDVTVDGQEVAATGAFRFFSPAGHGPAEAAQQLADATARGHVGVQVHFGAEASEVTAFDDINVTITRPAMIHGNDTLRVLVDSDLKQGRTIVLDVDPATLGGPDLVVRYYDVRGDNLTEVVIRAADSLADVLDPTDDAGQPEYWIVEDGDGLHVMVSVPHWSAHVIELASLGEFLVQPSVLLGAAAGILGVGVAGTAMFWPRRRSDHADY